MATNIIKLIPSHKGRFNVVYVLSDKTSILILEEVPELKAKTLAERLEAVLGCDRDAMMFRRQAAGAKKD